MSLIIYNESSARVHCEISNNNFPYIDMNGLFFRMLEKLGINYADSFVYNDRRYIHIKDDKYGIDGYFSFAPEHEIDYEKLGQQNLYKYFGINIKKHDEYLKRVLKISEEQIRPIPPETMLDIIKSVRSIQKSLYPSYFLLQLNKK